MATTDQLSEDQFHCSICRSVFSDPVTLPCGHNFCRCCIEQNWPIDSKCRCPSCKKIFFFRPELKVNACIAKIAAHFRESKYRSSRRSTRAARAGEVPCDVCTEPKHRALKSCLVCLSSYCESHLEPHLNMTGLKRHQLTEPRGNLEDRVCATHNKPLELFCQSECLCVCVFCVYEEHKGHEIIPLKDACDQQKIQLQTVDHLLQENINSRVKKITELRGSVRVSHAAANIELSDGVQVFKALKESVERGLDLLISEINKKKSHTEQQAGALIQEIEQELCELKKRRAELKQHSQDEDPILLLKTSQMNPETPTRDWTSASVCAPTYRGSVARAVSQLEQEFNEKTRRLFQEELRRVKSNKVHVPLETKSSETSVQQAKDDSELSQSKKAVSLSDGGYIEAQVRGKAEWTLGVAQESVNRKGSLTLNPQNGFWTMSLKDGRLYVSDNPKISVLTKCKPEKVGVSVDNKEGVISFYDVDASALLYSFTGVSFKEKLQPFCCPDLLYEEFFSGGLCLGCDDVRRQD